MKTAHDRRGATRVLLKVLTPERWTPERQMWLRPKRPTLGTRVEFKPEGYDYAWHEGILVATDGDTYWVEAR